MFDTHCHLTDAQFAGDLHDVLQRAWDAGLTGIISVASNAHDAQAAIRLAADPRIRATAGVHPHVAEQATDDDLAVIRTLVDDVAVVAIGETGLDFHYNNSPRGVQRRLFEWHLELAAETGLPVVVHSRTANADMAAMIRAADGVTGVLHCFTGDAALLDAALQAGWFIGYGGIVTFRNFAGADLLRAVPADRLLLETDSPYLAPIPHRGRRNEPSFIVGSCAAVAAVRDEQVDAVAAMTTANARRFYGLPEV